MTGRDRAGSAMGRWDLAGVFVQLVAGGGLTPLTVTATLAPWASLALEITDAAELS